MPLFRAAMDKLSKIACYFRWNRNDDVHQHHMTPTSSTESAPSHFHQRESDDCDEHRNMENDLRTRKFLSLVESILLWENSVNSVSVVVVFNILFWGIVVLEVRGFAAASSAALVVVLGYSTLEAQSQKEPKTVPTPPSPKVERINKIVRKAKTTLETLTLFRKNQPGAFCLAACTFSLGLWLIGRTINGVLLTYTICMIILVGPALLLQIPCKIFSPKELCHEYAVEWENEIEEFLPAATEDNLEVLQRAGESGEHYPTPHGALMENQNDPLNDEELAGLKMPSHEEGSTDGLDVSELDLSTGDDVDAIKIQSEHFQPGSSSSSSDNEEVDLEPLSRKLISHSEEESDSEFEIIDSREIAHLNDI